MKKKFLLLSFIEGGAVMATELCGAKLLAPVFGNGLFVWASVMGITLAALAAGYFFGGYISHKTKNGQKLLYKLLNVAAMFIVLMPLIAFYLVPRISYLPFLPAVLLSTITLVFFPIFFLGCTSPVFIAVQSNGEGREGKVSGTVYAVSTLGGILATFASGFYLVPLLGLTICLLSFGTLLFLANLLIFRLFASTQLFIWTALVYLNLQFKLRPDNTLFNRDGLYGNLKVEDLRYGNATIRCLKINEIPQSEMDMGTNRSVSPYLNLLYSLIPPGMNQRALVLGLGGGLMANDLIRKNYRVDAVEIDDRVIEVAKRFFHLSASVHTFNEDARYFLNHNRTKYGVIVVDLYRSEELPNHVLTVESLGSLKENLVTGGRVYVNWHGYLNGEIGQGSRILYNTFMRSGFNVKLCSDNDDEAHRNLIFVAGMGSLDTIPHELKAPLESSDLVNTDNNLLLEKYNALATKAWRSNYLRYYQGQK